MDSKDILLLKTLYEEKNITHTARRLFISQPAITDRLKRMEAEFGTTLFIRQPRGIRFTSAGELVHQYCLRTEKDYRQVRAALEGLATHPSGTLSIACSNVFAKYHMPRLLSQFQKTCPQIQIHLQSGFTHNLYRDFLQGKFQVCIVRETTTGRRNGNSCGRMPCACSAGIRWIWSGCRTIPTSTM